MLLKNLDGGMMGLINGARGVVRPPSLRLGLKSSTFMKVEDPAPLPPGPLRVRMQHQAPTREHHRARRAGGGLPGGFRRRNRQSQDVPGPPRPAPRRARRAALTRAGGRAAAGGAVAGRERGAAVLAGDGRGGLFDRGRGAGAAHSRPPPKAGGPRARRAPRMTREARAPRRWWPNARRSRCASRTPSPSTSARA